MPTKKTIVCTVTNDLAYDQRMQRICASLSGAGFRVLLVGRRKRQSPPFVSADFDSKRLFCFFEKGMLFYVEFQIRLFCFLLFVKTDAFYAVDLDTILPCLWASKWRQLPRLYDAHELFTEQKEIVTRPTVHKIWLAIERYSVPQFEHGYTVNGFIQAELQRRYGVQYGIVRNLPLLKAPISVEDRLLKEAATYQQYGRFILYQGAVNEGRSFETLIPAMRHVPALLVICGEGNFFEQTRALIAQHQLEHKVILKGYVAPALLRCITPLAYCGVTLFEDTGLNQYYSLANRFFDYMMGGIPQVCVNFPEYAAINRLYETALLIDDVQEQTIAHALNKLLTNHVIYNRLKLQTHAAKSQLNWQNESVTVISQWKQLLPS